MQVATFDLSDEEAAFIVDRLVDSNPIAPGLPREPRRPRGRRRHLDASARGRLPSASRRIVAHAEIFSEAMYGASLLYNLMLSERRGMPTGSGATRISSPGGDSPSTRLVCGTGP